MHISAFIKWNFTKLNTQDIYYKIVSLFSLSIYISRWGFMVTFFSVFLRELIHYLYFMNEISLNCDTHEIPIIQTSIDCYLN